MYNRIDLSNAAIDDKHIYLAFWPDSDEPPEVWTFRKAKEAFGEIPEVMRMIMHLAHYEELYHEESNFVLMRIPSWLDVPKIKYQVQ
tara:strand:- start:259 stop:519 length:261 start_codon:yes stop_codon:yes gene_type:complete